MLSFGEEAEEDEAETSQYVQKNASKPKSVHDIGDDPSLSKKTLAIEKKKNDEEEEEGGKKKMTKKKRKRSIRLRRRRRKQ